MFTGLIQSTGRISGIDRSGSDARIAVSCPEFDLASVLIGDSIAVSGVCLTVVERLTEGFKADVSGETLSLTTLGALPVGSLVNLEQSLRLSTPLGGHLVSGHVDGIATVLDLRDQGRSLRVNIEIPADLARYIARKGSITIDGISLTVNDITGNSFTVNIVPHTREKTSIRLYRPGVRVNIEVDLIARYLERLLHADKIGKYSNPGLDRDLLARHGYL